MPQALWATVLQGVSHWNVSFEVSLTDRNTQVKFCLKVVFECRDQIFFGITTSFCEIFTVRPLLDQMWITLSFIWFLLHFVLFLCGFSFDFEPVWFIHYYEWQLATLQPIFFLIFTVILQVFAAPLKIELFTYFQKPCKYL